MLAVMHEEFDSMEIDSMLNNLKNMKKIKNLIFFLWQNPKFQTYQYLYYLLNP